jgi:hypothetical protein
MNRLYPAAYAALALVLMLPFLGSGYVLALDMQFGPNTFAEHKYGDFFGYGMNPYGAYLPFRMVLGFLSQYVSVEHIQKALLFLVFFLPGLCMHASLPKELGNSRYLGGLLYTLNPFTYARFLAGHWIFLLSYALWPLAIKHFMDFLKDPGDRRKLTATALFTMAVSISSHGLAFLLLSYLFIFIMHAWRHPSLRLLLKKTAILGIIVFAMSLFWAVPSLLLFGSLYSPVTAGAYLEDFGTKADEMPLHLSVLTMHGFWRGGFTYTKDVLRLWDIAFLAMASISLLGLYALYRRNRLFAVSLVLVFIAGFLYSLGNQSPLAWTLSILDLPFYLFFRDVQKFVGLLALVYSIGAAYGAHLLLGGIKGARRAAALLAMLGIFALLSYGHFGFQGQMGLTHYPMFWEGAEAIISQDNASSSILALPPHLYAYYPWVNSSQKTLATPESQYFSSYVKTARNIETEHIYSDFNDPQGSYIRYLYMNRQHIDNTAEMLLPLNVRYVMLSYHYIESYHYSYMFYRVDGVEDIEAVFFGPDFTLFRNNLSKGGFLASKGNGSGRFKALMELGSEGGFSNNVSYEQLTPSLFRVDSCEHDYLVFSGMYSSMLEYKGQKPDSWHGLGSVFRYTGPGIVENTFFRYVLALFLLFWAVALAVVIDPPRLGYLVLAGLYALTYLLIFYGILSLYPIGGLLLVSFAAAGVLRLTSR